MASIYITRHGETVWNTERRMQGWQDSPLTPRGIKQAESLAERIKDVEFTKIYSSTSGRAKKTAEILKGNRILSIIEHPDLREMSCGDWEGQTTIELEQKYPKEFHDYWKFPHLYDRQSGETFKMLQKRVHPIIEEIITAPMEKNILIVTHGVTLNIIMAYLKKTSLQNLWDAPVMDQTSLNIVKVQDDNIEVLLYGDTSHFK